jgi:septal ring factor EnvC (AmiA/AmiB activator)
MLRRSQRSATPLHRQREELAQRESELRDEVVKLERMIAAAPKLAEEAERRQREELLMRAQGGARRLDVSIGLQDKRYGDVSPPRPRGALRKAQREGRIIFLVLAIALAALVIWLVSHFHW